MGYQIDLEVFNGPMDLLLYLISKDEVDIQEVSISSILDQYLEYLDRMRELNVDVTADFIVMASTLMLIKSQTMLPTEEIDIDEEIDQQGELIRHLLEYKKIKMLSRGLKDKAELRSQLVSRPHHSLSQNEEELSYEEVNLWDIIRAFARVVKETGLDRSFDVVHTDKPISAYITNILDVLDQKGEVGFKELFTGKINRSDAISIFVGLLELMKRKMVMVIQQEESPEIMVTLILDLETLRSIKENGVYHIHRLDGELDSGEEEMFPSPAEQEREPIPSDSDRPVEGEAL